MTATTPIARVVNAARYLESHGPLSGESLMLPALIEWLVSTRRISTRTAVAFEVPWLGRRIDLAIKSSRGEVTTFELKVGRFGRVLEQATYNRSSSHRSWVVTPNVARPENLEVAMHLGVGVLVVANGVVRVAAYPLPNVPDTVAASRLRAVLSARATVVEP